MKSRLSSTLVGVAVMGCLAAGSAAGFALRGSVIGAGGLSAPPATNGVFKQYGTAGQAGVGKCQSGAFGASSGFWSFGGPRVLAVLPPGAPVAFAFGPASPNPAREAASFELALPQAADVSLAVYDVAGREIGAETSARLAAGVHRLTWRAPAGGAGVYFVRLSTDGVVRARRTVVMIR